MPLKPSSLVSALSATKFEKSVREILTDPAPTFYRMVVLETIFDPSIIDQTKVEYWESILRVSNIRFANILPRNTIIGQKMLTGMSEISRPMFLLPFFPSHLSLPCKPGEIVWTMFEDPNAKNSEMGYWFCRVAEPHFIDDVNHTHHPRQFDYALSDSLRDRFQGTNITNRVYENRIGRTVQSDAGNRFVEIKSEILPFNEEDEFERLLTDTDAGKITQYESIPRFRKRPGDIAFEGTNNSLIVLGTDRAGSVSAYDVDPQEPERGLVPLGSSDLFGNAGSIDIVAGRGTLPVTGGTEISVTEINTGQELKKELGKTPGDVVPSEGDPDLINDRSRILVSQRTLTDTNFGTSNYNSQFGIGDSTTGDASVVIKSDKVRIIARSDISLIVQNFNLQAASGSKPELMLDNDDQKKWASITIKTNGDIVFTPSDTGYIKLGDDSADRALLCTDAPAQAQNGTVSFPSGIISTGADVVGIGGQQGTFAKKILVK